ncbi:hypothetical protein Egran_02455 [Elaphomyces granulatus]|uniref:Phospholipase/carboxylesterase/thioesterase domain-containing protein n=1 Tax=Elaphomyces granulatus TaxID=519963 RepID=A0A232M045_9EURO|nr:hypothetical protein Egran_02455 [Elaphomyces granulatus]
MESTSSMPDGFPSPVIIPPRGPNHTHTLILLHGRGDNGLNFGPAFLCTPLPRRHGKLLPQRFPTVKFVFPSAAQCRSISPWRSSISQWFDIYSLQDPETMDHVQYEGLRASGEFLRSVVEEEAKVLEANLDLDPGSGKGRIVLGGLSQGCAMGLCVLLGGFTDESGHNETSPLAGFVGMAGWLPFCSQLERFIISQEPSQVQEQDDDTVEAATHSMALNAANYVRDVIMNLPLISSTNRSAPASLQTPIWLGHGVLDEKVRIDLGRRAATAIRSLGWDLALTEYGELAHWYIPSEVEDIATFLRDQVGIPEARV